MTRELETCSSQDTGKLRRSESILVLCDEGEIRCQNLVKLRKSIAALGENVILGIPNDQYQEGLRGWAKVQVLASLLENVRGVLPVSSESVIDELAQDWLGVHVQSSLVWDRQEKLLLLGEEPRPKILTTTDQFDLDMIARAKKIVESSNCWLDPAGCVIVRGDRVLIESTSTNFNQTNCREIPLTMAEIQLKPGERMMFCDSLHAERVGISQAAREGVCLDGATMYIDKYPCRPCLQSALAAGIKTIVFERGSYGLTETADLVEANSMTIKQVAV